MPIVAADIKIYLSGGAANADPDASTGGAISSVEVVDNTLHNLFDVISGAESAAGDTEYRCVYLKNTHATLDLLAAKVYIDTNTPSTETSAEIGLGAAALSDTEAAIADENTAPASVTFSTADGVANALTIGDIGPGEYKAIWVKRVVDAGASAYNNDQVSIAVTGDTAA